MPRMARIRSISSTGFYHIVIRGNNKKYIFKEMRFKLDYYELLCEQEKLKLIELAAWCIMDNHVHIILKASIENLSEAFKSINIKFAHRYNTGTGSVGHVYDCRFMSKAIDTNAYLLQSIRYVHNNPVQANMTLKPEDYNWSSYILFKKYPMNLHRPQMNFIMSYFDSDYKKFSKWHTGNDAAEHLDIKEDLRNFYWKRASHIVTKHLHKNQLTKCSDLKQKKLLFDKMLIELIRNTHLPLRQLADYLDISYSRIQSLNASFNLRNDSTKKS